MTCLRKPKPINGCKANGIRRRSGWFHRFKAHANFHSVKMFDNTMGGCVFLYVIPNYCVCRGVSVCGRNQNARKLNNSHISDIISF
jgi:hypothetical protein